jgi:hypothetical protein
MPDDEEEKETHVPSTPRRTSEGTRLQSPLTPQHSYNLRRRERRDYSEMSKKGHVMQTYLKQAIRESYKATLIATTIELKQLDDKQTWVPIKAQDLTQEESKQVIRSMVFLKQKYLPDGTPDKFKARLVADGSKQSRDAYTEDQISSPTANLASVFMVAAIAAHERRHVVTADVSGAYLNASMGDHVVHMVLDPICTAILCKLNGLYNDYVTKNGTCLVKLRKALYGCVQSARLWYDTIIRDLKRLGFIVNESDPCLLNRGSGDKQMTIIVYVDDLFMTSKNKHEIMTLIALLNGYYGKLTVTEGNNHSYLGMNFNFTKDSCVLVSMIGYVNDILVDNNVDSFNQSPAVCSLFTSTTGSAYGDTSRTAVSFSILPIYTTLNFIIKY